jgi:hypothetical protein
MKQVREDGFTLVELIFGAVIMAMMVASIGELYISNINTLVLGKSRAIGVALANEKMEALRDLPYDSVATKNGNIYPPGNILDDEVLARDNFTFKIHTEVFYVDDPYDGFSSCPCATGPAAGKPQDLYSYDYKKAQVTVSLASSNKVVATLTTDIAGKAAETLSNTGILSITVLDANGLAVPNANVTIVNNIPSPAVNIVTTTDNNGLVLIPKLPPDSGNNYQVTASLPSYSTDGTIPDPPGAQTATQLNPNILVQQITSLTLKIDRLATLYEKVVDTTGAPLPSFNVTTTGAKQIKATPTVYKYSGVTATDASGNITLSGLEWDSYSFSVPSGYYLVSASPYAPVALAPNSAASVTLVVSTNSAYPTISSSQPIAVQTGTAALSLKVTGTNLASGSTLALKMTGQTDIPGTACVSASGNTTYTCTLNLTGAATGAWDIVVVRSGNTATQTGGVNVTP